MEIKPPVSKKLIDDLFDNLAAAACDTVAAGEEATPQLMLFHADGEHATLLSSAPSEEVHAMQHTSVTLSGKSMLAAVVESILKVDTVDVVVHICEMWMRQFTIDSPAAIEEFLKAQAVYERGDMAKSPERKEAVVINIHTRTQSYSALLPIETDPSGKRHCKTPAALLPKTGGRLIPEPQPTEVRAVLYSDGTEKVLDSSLTWSQICEALDAKGLQVIKLHHLGGNPLHLMYADDLAMHKGKQVNETATDLYWKNCQTLFMVHGDVIIQPEEGH